MGKDGVCECISILFIQSRVICALVMSIHVCKLRSACVMEYVCVCLCVYRCESRCIKTSRCLSEAQREELTTQHGVMCW